MKFTTKKVFIPVKGQAMLGTLYYPSTNKDKLPGVIIFHGRGSSQARYTDRAEELAKAGFITLIFSFRGCGNSDGKFSEQTIEMGHEDAVAGYNFLLQQDKVNKNRIGVYGGSYGGYQASLLVKDKNINSLILAAPALYKNEWWNVVLESLGEEIRQKYRDENNFSDNKALKAISRYRGPLLVIEHELDSTCPKKQTDTIFNNAKLASPKKIIVLKGSKHTLVEKKHRNISNKITVEWFTRTL